MNWFKRWQDQLLDALADKVAARIGARKPTKKEPSKINLEMYEHYQRCDTFTIGEVYQHKMKRIDRKPPGKKHRRG